MKFQGDILNFCDFIQVFVFTTNHHLKADLHRVNIVPNPICDCGIDIENAGHYFFFCTQYNDQRDNLFSALNFIPFVDLDLLLNCSSDFNHELNKRAILAVIKYIKDTRRFT